MLHAPEPPEGATVPASLVTGAYLRAQGHCFSPEDVVRALFQGMVRNIIRAREAHLNGNLEAMCALNQKTFKILIALQGNIDLAAGGESARLLSRFYTAVFIRLARVLRAKKPQDEFLALEKTLKDVSGNWKPLPKMAKAGKEKTDELL